MILAVLPLTYKSLLITRNGNIKAATIQVMTGIDIRSCVGIGRFISNVAKLVMNLGIITENENKIIKYTIPKIMLEILIFDFII